MKKILIDIGHPAHVHYFKNLIKILKNKGHKFCIISRDKDVAHSLLKTYNISFISRGKGAKSFLGKFLYLFRANYIIYKAAKSFNPDIFLSFASPYAAQVSWLLKKHHIAFTDTEHAKLGNFAFSKFSKTIVTPECLPVDFGLKHIKFNGYMELSYLHPNYFKGDDLIHKVLGLGKKDKYVLLRFVSWDASHDYGMKGLTYDLKVEMVQKLSKHCKVFISSEQKLPEVLKKYQIKISPYKIHDVLKYCSLFIGEGATMASECAVLGVPAIYLNEIECSTCSEQQHKYDLLYNFRSFNGVVDKALRILDEKDRKKYRKKSDTMIKSKVDVTKFMVKLVEDFPDSIKDFK